MSKRYASWNGDLGKGIQGGDFTLESLSKLCIDKNLQPKHVSGQQELLENKVNNVLYG